MGVQYQTLKDVLYVGDQKTLSFDTTVEGLTTARNPNSSSTMLVLDADRDTSGTATAAGTTTSLTDSARASDAADLWNGVNLRLTKATTGHVYTMRVLDFAAGVFTLTPCPEAIASGDTYELIGYPLLVQTAITPVANKGSVTVGPNDATAYAKYQGEGPGRRAIIYRADFGTDEETLVAVFTVHPAP